MKYLALLALVALSACSTSPPRETAAKFVAPVRQAITSAQTQVSNAQTSAGKIKVTATKLEALPQTPELHALVLTLQGQVDGLTKELLTANQALIDAQLKTKLVEDKLDQTIAERDAAVAKVAVTLRRYDKIKFAICTLLAAAAFMLLWRFKALLVFAGPYIWIAFLVGPVAIFALAWKAIDWVL